MLIESSNGANASAILYSLVEISTTNVLNTFEYFNLLLAKIPQHMNNNDLRFLDDLLPWTTQVQKTCPSKYKNLNFQCAIYFYKINLIPRNAEIFVYLILMFEGLHILQY